VKLFKKGFRWLPKDDVALMGGFAGMAGFAIGEMIWPHTNWSFLIMVIFFCLLLAKIFQRRYQKRAAAIFENLNKTCILEGGESQ
jgi:hypothetical protein